SSEAQQNLDDALAPFTTDVATYEAATHEHAGQAIAEDADNAALHQTTERLAPLAESSRDLLKAADHLHRPAGQVIDTLGGAGRTRDINRQRRAADEARRAAVEALKPVRYFHRQALWLQERFPEAELRDVP